MSTESAVAPDEENSEAMIAYSSLVEAYYAHRDNGGDEAANLAALNEYEKRLLKLKLDGERRGVTVVRSPTLGISIQRDEIDKH